MLLRYRYALLLLGVLVINSCSNSENKKNTDKLESETSHIEVDAFKNLINGAKVNGTILIYEPENKTYYSNNFKWAHSGFLPASTFKIPNSMIALESNVISNDSTIIPWDGNKKRFKIWEQDLTFRNAFHYSCVPCYQRIARNVGTDLMKTKLKEINFGNMTVDSSNLDMFWLEGNSRITAYEQIDFLERFNMGKLPIAKRTELMMKKMMVITENDTLVIRGKTGWSNANSINNGWFVGYIEKKNDLYYFATNIEPHAGVSLKTFAEIRRSLTYKALEILYKK